MRVYDYLTKYIKIIKWHFSLPQIIWDGADMEPHGAHFLSEVQNETTYDLSLDQKVKFKVILLPKNLFMILDEMEDPFMATNEQNIRLFQPKITPNESPLGCDLNNLKLHWSKIKKVEIQIGDQVHKPFQNDKILADVEMPEFTNFEKELFPADVDTVTDEILLNIKLAKEGIEMNKIHK